MIISIVIVFVMITGMCFMCYKEKLKNYYDNYTPFSSIPDLTLGFIPQGIANDGITKEILLSGYMGNGDSSRLYVIDESREVKKLLLQTENGKMFTGHAGGVSVYKDNVYIAGSTKACMYYFPLSVINDLKDENTVSFEGNIELKNDEDYLRVSFTAVDDKYLYAGEFHHNPIFSTHVSHRIRYKNELQRAYLMGFVIDEKKATPTCVYSIPDKVQGACFDGEYIYLSQSKKFFSSRILSYSKEGIIEQGKRRVFGVDVPLYILSESEADKITNIPPMSEEIVVVDDRMYILYEAASNRYRFGRFFGLDKIHSVPVEYVR